MLRYIILCLLFILLSTQAYGEDNLAPFFQNESQTIKSGCKIKRLKAKSAKNCVIETFDGHDLVLDIYDSTGQDKYAKAEQIRITSWYNEATVHYEDLLGHGTDFILIEFEGNTGTGTLQKILAVIGWKEDRFVPVLIEPLSYYIEDRGFLTDLKVDYSIEDKGSKKVTIMFNYNYSKDFPKETLKQTWSDNLFWNEMNFSFYDKKNEQKKTTASKFSIQKRILDVRIRIAESISNLANLDMDTLRQIKIMEILD